MNLSEEELKKETHHLELTTKLLREQISALAQDLYDNEEKQQEFKKFIWDTRAELDPTEMKTIMSNNDQEIDNLEMKAKYYRKLYQVQNSPYFAKIVFESDEGKNDIYIGLTYLTKDNENIIFDWRAPISSIFYDYESGDAQYEAPGGIIKGYLHNKRQFTIEDSKIKRVFDSKLNVQDELLQEVLANKTDEYMKNIVNTIQTEQNAIIRNVKDKNLIVQGIAGSGKTSVALHRIAFLLYKIDRLTSKNVLIFSPNNIFTEYISNVLPELGEDNTMQTTFNDFLSTNLSEFKHVESFSSFVERYYKYVEPNKNLVRYKQSDDIILALDDYIDDLLKNVKFTDNLKIDDFEIEKDELNYLLKDRYSKLLLFDRIEEIAEKICRDYFNGSRGRKSTILSRLKKLLSISLNFKDIYKDFLGSTSFLLRYEGSITENEINSTVAKRDIKYEDACLLVYLKGKLEGFNYLGLIKEVVIDEAQDYTKLQYMIIRNIFKKSGFTILGDINQTVNPYYKYNSLEELSSIFDNGTIYLELTKTYRSTPEIIEHTNRILKLNHVSAIRRDNNKPVLFRNEITNLKESIVNDVKYLQNSKFSVAIITKTDEEASKLYELVKDDIEGINVLNNNSSEFNKKLIIIPSYIAKGLEFDSVIIYTDVNNYYKENEKNLYYVACTRAQHELIIYNQPAL
jgi:DNA helicase-2/ATP-dependent DNA helicase PcrA